MTTYICKCGCTFQKHTEAGTTGFRMPDYGPGHECFGCPFVCEVMTWDPTTQESAVQNHECRGSKRIRYDTTAALSRGDKCVGRIYSLDLEFLHRVRDFADTLDGIEPDRHAFSDRPADYGDDGRFRLTIYPAQNNKGIAAKRRIFERFFNPDGSRVDVAPEQEKEIVLIQIKEAKAVAQGKETPVKTGTVYYHNNLIYFADQREGSKKFAVFMDDADHPSPCTRMEVATIPDFDTFDGAQNALNGLALKRGFSTKRSTDAEISEMEQSENDLGPDGMEELAEYQELTQPGEGPADDASEAEQQGANNDPSESDDENAPSDNDAGNSVNDPGEQPPQSCDWSNASGDEEHPEDNAVEDNPAEVAGSPLDLRGEEFRFILDPANTALNRFVAMLHAKKQHEGEINIKVTFEDDGGSYIFGGAVSGKINLAMKPQKVVGDAVELKFDEQGNPIVPADREHQLSFDEVPPESGGTATVDGNTGIVEHFEENQSAADESKDEQAGQDEPATENKPKELYPCKNVDCPFYEYDADGAASGCGFGNFEREKIDLFDVTEAVEQNSCTREGVLQVYADSHPEEDESSESEVAK